MTQTDTNTRITGLGFYLDEIEKPIFCIFLDRICLDNGRINYDEADRLLVKDEDCALLGKCLASALNHEFGEELLSCHYSSSTDINRPCLILLPEKVKDEPAIACVQKAANELLVDFEHVCHDTH